MKHLKNIVAILLVALLMIGIIQMCAFAASENTPKEEVIYINLNADGSVKEINVVNIFDLDADGKIIDYGKYESIRNMTTTDKIGYVNETVTIDAKAGKLYYEGKLSSKVMPWNISIKYYMDGKEYKASEIAGKSGNLKITMKITENTECSGSFFEGYALQASVTLDTKKCTNIVADGATVANVGSKKQLTYTILPNKGADIEITAKVKKFEMSAIAINGIKLNLAIEIDNDVISEKIGEIINAVKNLDAGANELNAGAKDLYDGTTTLKDKFGELHTGVGALVAGADDLANGLNSIASKNKELLGGAYEAFKGICAASEMILNAELNKNGLSTVKLTPENYSTVLTELLKKMDADAVYSAAYNKALAEVKKQVEAQSGMLYAGYVEQNADVIYLAYLKPQEDTFYAQIAAQAVLEQLIANGYNNQQAVAYLQTAEGKALIAQSVSAMTDEQKHQILAAAVQSLTEEQKTQIKAGAVASLTNEQKAQIKNGYIDQMMKSKEVTDKITATVAMANSAAASVTAMKGQLDNYSLFYEGLKSYTSAVDNAAIGANKLNLNMDKLYTNVGILKTSVGNLNDGVKELFDGTTMLKDGIGKFAKVTDGIEIEFGDEVDKIIAEATGRDVELTSFVSDNNTNVDAVQFVIQTEAIEIAEVLEAEPVVVKKLNFWQKLLRLFGLY